MKTRQQFVSNSSSTSYVVIGKKVEGSWEEAEEYTENNPDVNCIYLDGEGYFIGKVIHEDDNECSDGNTYLSAKELTDVFAEVSKNLHIPVEDLELFCGTVQS